MNTGTWTAGVAVVEAGGVVAGVAGVAAGVAAGVVGVAAGVAAGVVGGGV